MEFYATCTPGLEFISAKEIEGKKLGRVIELREGRGRVLFESEYDLIPLLNCSLRSVERVVLLLARERASDLDGIYKAVKRIDFSFIRPEWSFAVRSNRLGEHNFTSVDIGRVAGQAVIDSYIEAKGVRLKVNLDSPDVIVRCDLIKDELLVGIDTTGDEGLHKRNYRVYQHPAPLNPALASSLIYLSEWDHEHSLLDPFCGSGTILFEAGMIARNTPVCKFRRDFAFLKFFGELPRFEERDVELKLYGVEKFRKHIEGAELIASYVGIYPKFIRGYAERIGEYFDSVDFIVTNPPYGLRIGRKGTIEKIYAEFLKAASSILKERMVLITSETSIFERHARDNFEVIKKLEVMYGGLRTCVYTVEV